ncbi:MAG: ImuA family protein, partial [Geminicoccaceae bacterium]
MNILENRSNRQGCLAELRRRIGAIERGSFGVGSTGALKEAGDIDGLFSSLSVPLGADQFGFEPIWDREGMAGPALHELIADGYGDQPAVRSFALALTASLLHRQTDADAQGFVLWCQRQRDVLEFGRLYGPGLRELGLSPDRLIMVTGRRDADCLWAMEQGLGSRSLVAVIGAVDRVDLIASRRLSLASSAHRTHCLLLPSAHGLEPSAARTRWRIKTAPSIPDHLDQKGLGRPCWQLTLERNRFGRTGYWTVEWDHASYRFHLVA